MVKWVLKVSLERQVPQEPLANKDLLVKKDQKVMRVRRKLNPVPCESALLITLLMPSNLLFFLSFCKNIFVCKRTC